MAQLDGQALDAGVAFGDARECLVARGGDLVQVRLQFVALGFRALVQMQQRGEVRLGPRQAVAQAGGDVLHQMPRIAEGGGIA